MPSSPRPESLRDLALTRLRKLFPCSKLVRQFDTRVIDDILAVPRCTVKSCPFPAHEQHALCRGHLADRKAAFSVLPSTHPPTFSLHGRAFAASR